MANREPAKIEDVIIRAALHRTYHALKTPVSGQNITSAEAVHTALKEIDQKFDVTPKEVARYIAGQSVARAVVDKITPVVFEFIERNIETIEREFSRDKDERGFDLLCTAMNRRRTDDQPSGENDGATAPHRGPVVGHNLQKVVENLSNSAARGNRVLATGVYQIFRRYKPTAQQRELQFYQDDANHPVITELAYVDSEAMECMLITAEGNVYWGALYINHQNILYVIAQRPNDEYPDGINQRMYGVKLEGRSPRIFSGVCIKSGDTTRYPVAAESIFIWVSETGNEKLYEKFVELRKIEWSVLDVYDDPVFMDYIIERPDEFVDPDREPVGEKARFIKDFPSLVDMTRKRDYGVIFLRESLRALPAPTLRGWNLTHRLQVFRHSLSGPGRPDANATSAQNKGEIATLSPSPAPSPHRS